jgi:hypothetical protein
MTDENNALLTCVKIEEGAWLHEAMRAGGIRLE